jgi:hypothetical protein
MANFSIPEEETKVVGTATFNKAEDFKAVVLDGETMLLHKIHADDLISRKLATLAKDVKIKEQTPPTTVTKLEK